MNATVTSSHSRGVLVENNGVGYLLKVADPTPFVVGKQTRVYIYKFCAMNSVKQDLNEEYYGFLQVQERDLFGLLISVPGVGPKTALTIIGHGHENICKKLANRDIFGLQALEGIRPNIAVNLVDHLAHRFADRKNPADLRLTKAAEALRSLGYRSQQIEHALSAVKSDNAQVEQVIADSIKLIGQLSESERSKA